MFAKVLKTDFTPFGKILTKHTDELETYAANKYDLRLENESLLAVFEQNFNNRVEMTRNPYVYAQKILDALKEIKNFYSALIKLDVKLKIMVRKPGNNISIKQLEDKIYNRHMTSFNSIVREVLSISGMESLLKRLSNVQIKVDLKDIKKSTIPKK